MQTINYKSDFKAELTVRDAAGNNVRFLGFDWTARFWTGSKAVAYVARSRAGVLENAAISDNGRLFIYFDNHHLSPGRLNVEFSVDTADAEFPDGNMRNVSAQALDLELVAASGCPGGIRLEVDVPVIVQQQPVPVRANGPAVLQRGMISLKSEGPAGVIYKNLGYIRIPTGMSEGEDVAGTIDLGNGLLDGIGGIKNVEVVFGGKADGSSAFIDEAGVLHYSLLYAPHRYLRLRIKDSQGYRYLTVSSRGRIEFARLAFDPVEPVTAAPDLGFLSQTSTNPLHVLARDGKLEIELKERHARNSSKGRVYRRKWVKVRVENGMLHGHFLKVSRGVARVRYRRKGRKPASAWRVFSFNRNGFVSILS